MRHAIAVTVEKAFCSKSIPDSQHMVIRADIFIMPVFHTESAWNNPQLHKTKPFVQMSGMDIGCDNCIELQHTESQFLALNK